MNYGMDVQRDPYSHLMSQHEKQYARNLPFRLFFNSSMAALYGVYYISRQNEVGRMKALKLSIDVIVNVALRSALAFVVADQASRRMFVNYIALKQHQIAEYEIKKVMRTWPNPKPYLMPHQRANSYFWC